MEYTGKKYKKLYDYFLNSYKDTETLTFTDIEEIIGGELPNSAYKHGAWWGNENDHKRHSASWIQAGWKVIEKNLENKEIIFKKINTEKSSDKTKIIDDEILEKQYNPEQHVEYKNGKKITKINAHKLFDNEFKNMNSTNEAGNEFYEEKRKQEIKPLINVYGKNKIVAYVLNLIFPGLGLFYLEKKDLGILLIVITLIIYIEVRGIWLIRVVLVYNFSSLLFVANVFVPNNFLIDVRSHILDIDKRQNEINKNMNSAKEDDNEFENINGTKEVGNEFKEYEEDINDLKTQYQSKEEIAKKMIQEHFPPPQLTYDRFMGEIDMWGEIFLKQTESTLNIINMAPGYTPKIDEELKNRLDTLKSFVKKMEELVVELTINLGNSSRKTNVEDVKELLTDMQSVIDSVKEYD
ncbi:MAG: hypothetical protein LBT10_04735 [Methanobrevibacter sp.]|jgi:hypothetical protein|nr:hypothetical protein [Methanobrevibacter sp.]